MYVRIYIFIYKNTKKRNKIRSEKYLFGNSIFAKSRSRIKIRGMKNEIESGDISIHKHLSCYLLHR